MKRNQITYTYFESWNKKGVENVCKKIKLSINQKLKNAGVGEGAFPSYSNLNDFSYFNKILLNDH